MVLYFTYWYKLKACLTNTKVKIDDSDTEEVDKMNIINIDFDVINDIDAVS